MITCLKKYLVIKNKIYKKILEEIKIYNLDSKEYEKMEDIEKLMMEEKEHYEDAYDDGVEVGINQSKREIVKNMLIENVDVSLISKYTNMPIEKIESLR